MRGKPLPRDFKRSPATPMRAAVPLKRLVRSTEIDFTQLELPDDVTAALADAFWHHFGPSKPLVLLVLWAHLKVFSRFVRETDTIQGLRSIDGKLLAHYIEWLNRQRRSNGVSWAKSTRSAAYTALRKPLQWLERCRPGLLPPIQYPHNPFPWRNRDSGHVPKIPTTTLRAILRACERDIAAIRERQAVFAAERVAYQGEDEHPASSRAALIAAIERQFQGLIPPSLTLARLGNGAVRGGLHKFGGVKTISPLLYPDAHMIVAYYLAIMIHAAGNPIPIAELTVDCLQPIPLLEGREMLVWVKGRASQVQRRSFSSTDPNEPPTLVRDILARTEYLRHHASPALKNRLFIFRGMHGRISALSLPVVKAILSNGFLSRHGLSHFSLASIRPSVLSSFYRASGDLSAVKQVANHRSIATTVRYVDSPQVQAEYRVRVAALQASFVGHFAKPEVASRAPRSARAPKPSTTQAVSMFGFDCKDPFEGIAPGSRRGSLCTQFLGCFTCPNAIIPDDPRTLARLRQAREHLREAASRVHPARWQAIYAPTLTILEHDILPRFSAAAIAAAESLQATLPPLPELR